MNNIKEAITNRWENSANGYDTYIQGEINTFKEKGWRDLILSEFEQDKLNILDIGTGPGFFSLILSKEGHKLTGIDCSKEMIEVAKKNCKNTNSEFYVMDSHKLDFYYNSFDIIVCRNVTWTLYNPKKAYKEWTRVLKPGGKIIIFDANWYLSYFDENLRKEVEKAQVNYKNKYGTPYESCTKETPDEFYKSLPLSSKLRPNWDESYLKQLGYDNIKIDKNIIEKVYDEREMALYACTPLFKIVATKNKGEILWN